MSLSVGLIEMLMVALIPTVNCEITGCFGVIATPSATARVELKPESYIVTFRIESHLSLGRAGHRWIYVEIDTVLQVSFGIRRRSMSKPYVCTACVENIRTDSLSMSQGPIRWWRTQRTRRQRNVNVCGTEQGRTLARRTAPN